MSPEQPSFDEPTYRCARCLDVGFLYGLERPGPKESTYTSVTACLQCDRGRMMEAGLWYRRIYDPHAKKPGPNDVQAGKFKRFIASQGPNGLAVLECFERIVKREKAQDIQEAL